MKKTIITFAILGLFSTIAVPSVSAGTLYPTSEPGETMYSLQEIYDLVTASTTSSIGNGDSFTVPEVSDSMVTLTELYNAVLALKNATTTTTGTPPVTEIIPENLNDHSNISSIFKQGMSTSNRAHFQFEVSAIGKDIYVKKDVDISNVLVGDVPLTSQVTSAETSLIHLASYDDDTFAITQGPAVNGYFVIPAGTTKLFRQIVLVNNIGSTPEIKLGLDAIDYKVGSDTAGLRTLDLDQNEYQTPGSIFTTPTI